MQNVTVEVLRTSLKSAAAAAGIEDDTGALENLRLSWMNVFGHLSMCLMLHEGLDKPVKSGGVASVMQHINQLLSKSVKAEELVELK